MKPARLLLTTYQSPMAGNVREPCNCLFSPLAIACLARRMNESIHSKGHPGTATMTLVMYRLSSHLLLWLTMASFALQDVIPRHCGCLFTDRPVAMASAEEGLAGVSCRGCCGRCCCCRVPLEQQLAVSYCQASTETLGSEWNPTRACCCSLRVSVACRVVVSTRIVQQLSEMAGKIAAESWDGLPCLLAGQDHVWPMPHAVCWVLPLSSLDRCTNLCRFTT